MLLSYIIYYNINLFESYQSSCHSLPTPPPPPPPPPPRRLDGWASGLHLLKYRSHITLKNSKKEE